MLRDYDAGKILREGIATAIVGKPNVGKSTLMNMLSGSQRSIVTEIAGTTRDIIEENVIVGDIMLRLADTAGIHKTSDTVESIGVERAKEKIAASQLILAVFDSSKPLDEDDIFLIKSIDAKNSIIIINKTDIESGFETSIFEDFITVRTSAKTGEGYKQRI